MVATNNAREVRHPRSKSQSGAAGERLELLKLRDSADPAARAIALLGNLLLRMLDDDREGES